MMPVQVPYCQSAYRDDQGLWLQVPYSDEQVVDIFIPAEAPPGRTDVSLSWRGFIPPAHLATWVAAAFDAVPYLADQDVQILGHTGVKCELEFWSKDAPPAKTYYQTELDELRQELHDWKGGGMASISFYVGLRADGRCLGFSGAREQLRDRHQFRC